MKNTGDTIWLLKDAYPLTLQEHFRRERVDENEVPVSKKLHVVESQEDLMYTSPGSQSHESSDSDEEKKHAIDPKQQVLARGDSGTDTAADLDELFKQLIEQAAEESRHIEQLRTKLRDVSVEVTKFVESQKRDTVSNEAISNESSTGAMQDGVQHQNAEEESNSNQSEKVPVSHDDQSQISPSSSVQSLSSASTSQPNLDNSTSPNSLLDLARRPSITSGELSKIVNKPRISRHKSHTAFQEKTNLQTSPSSGALGPRARSVMNSKQKNAQNSFFLPVFPGVLLEIQSVVEFQINPDIKKQLNRLNSPTKVNSNSTNKKT